MWPNQIENSEVPKGGKPSTIPYFRPGMGLWVAFVLIVITFSLTTIFLKRDSLRRFFFPTYLDRLEATPEDKIDIANVALNLAKDFYPTISVEAYSKTIDDIAMRVRQKIKDSEDPRELFRALYEIVLYPGEYALDRSVDVNKLFEPAFLNKLLDTKLGNCVTMTTLYMAVAQRLGYPVFMVQAPGHLFLRYEPQKGDSFNLEIIRQGFIQTDQDYIDDFSLTEKSIKAGGYLRTMSRREAAGVLVFVNAQAYLRRGNIDKAIEYGERSVKLNPFCPECYSALKTSYQNRSVLKGGQSGIRDFDIGEQFGERAKALGKMSIWETNAWKEKS